MTAAHKLGFYGEQLAVEFLEELGMDIIDRNYRCQFGEIDIIARDHDTIVIVEVKTRSSVKYGFPIEQITARKVHTLRRLAAHWMTAEKPLVHSVRIDVVSVVVWPNGEVEIDRVEGIA